MPQDSEVGGQNARWHYLHRGQHFPTCAASISTSDAFSPLYVIAGKRRGRIGQIAPADRAQREQVVECQREIGARDEAGRDRDVTRLGRPRGVEHGLDVDSTQVAVEHEGGGRNDRDAEAGTDPAPAELVVEPPQRGGHTGLHHRLHGTRGGVAIRVAGFAARRAVSCSNRTSCRARGERGRSRAPASVARRQRDLIDCDLDVARKGGYSLMNASEPALSGDAHVPEHP